jgi:hypothetical protein
MAVKKQRKPESAGRDMKASRRAVGFNVIISLVAAAALLIVINVIGDLLSRERNLRWNVETLGRHRLSDTAKRVLEQVRQPVRLTTIYTSTDPDKKPEQYLPQLRDLLEEMRQWKKDITVVHATTDRAKAEVVARLRQRLDKAAEKHRKLIEGFQLLAQSQETLLEQEAQNWRAYPPKGYLAQFGLPKAFETYLTTTKESLRKLSIQLRQDLSGDVLPNYPELSSLIEEALEALQKALEGVRVSGKGRKTAGGAGRDGKDGHGGDRQGRRRGGQERFPGAVGSGPGAGEDRRFGGRRRGHGRQGRSVAG